MPDLYIRAFVLIYVVTYSTKPRYVLREAVTVSETSSGRRRNVLRTHGPDTARRVYREQPTCTSLHLRYEVLSGMAGANVHKVRV